MNIGVGQGQYMRGLVVLCATLVLGGCADGDWERLTSYDITDHARIASLPPEPAHAAPPDAGEAAPVAVQDMAQPEYAAQPEGMAQPEPAAAPEPVYEAPQSVAGLQKQPQVFAPSPNVAPASAPVAETAQALSGARMAAMAAHCKSVARQRATDGGYMGYDDELQERVFKGTYTNCMAWETAHAF